MELDIANAALELSVRFPADASDEALAIFVKTHTELTNRINEQRRKLNETVIKVVDSALDSFSDNSDGCYGATSFMRRTIKNQDTPWVNLLGCSYGTFRMVRYNVTQEYYAQRYPGEYFAIVYSDLHTVANGNAYLAGVRSHLRDIYKAADATEVSNIEAFIATYLTHDDRYNSIVQAAQIERQNGNFQYVIWR